MRSVAVIAMVGALAFALGGPAAARGPGGGGAPPTGGSHGAGMSAPRGGGMGMAMPGRGYGGQHFSMNSNLRSNSGGLRRGSTRAAYVHGLNSQRTRMAGPRPPIPGGPTAAAAPKPPIAGGPGGAPPPPPGGRSGPAIPPSGITGSSQTPNR